MGKRKATPMPCSCSREGVVRLHVRAGRLPTSWLDIVAALIGRRGAASGMLCLHELCTTWHIQRCHLSAVPADDMLLLLVPLQLAAAA
jgi:hypothetical protein